MLHLVVWRMKNNREPIVTSCAPSCTFTTMDERLKQLVTQVQQYVPQSEERQLALTRLVDEILRYAFRRLH